MAASPTEKTKQEVDRTGGEKSDENEVETSLDDFLRDTNDLVNSATQDKPNSPASSENSEGEFFKLRTWASGNLFVVMSRDTEVFVRFN